MGESRVTVQLDLTQSCEKMADAVIQACFPEGTASQFAAINMAEIVEPWVETTWMAIRHAMVMREYEDGPIEEVRKALVLATWKQAASDLFNRDVRVVAKESAK